ncbi:hypothetical protein C8J57DRAFT_1475502 [Mycena rebaudengoi]|nr:hypothetical protein C8J57DRAFT_1475502 [Mycena rebaudengoi]
MEGLTRDLSEGVSELVGGLKHFGEAERDGKGGGSRIGARSAVVVVPGWVKHEMVCWYRRRKPEGRGGQRVVCGLWGREEGGEKVRGVGRREEAVRRRRVEWMRDNSTRATRARLATARPTRLVSFHHARSAHRRRTGDSAQGTMKQASPLRFSSASYHGPARKICVAASEPGTYNDAGILRLPCYQPERVALAAPEEACEHWLERAAVSVSAGMIEGASALLPHRIPICTNIPHSCTFFLVVPTQLSAHAAFCPRLCLGPPANFERAISSSTPMSTPTRIRILSLPHTSPPVRTRARRCFVCVDPLGEGPGRGDSALRGHRGWQCEVWISATWPSGVSAQRVREACEGRVGKERREGKADAGVVGVKRECASSSPHIVSPTSLRP